MKLSRSARLRITGALLCSVGIVACVLDPLNPQPLPPEDTKADFESDSGVFRPPPDAGRENPTVLDAGDTLDGQTPSPPPTGDGGDAGADADAGDAGDGGPG